MLTLDGRIVEQVDGVIAYHVPDCAEIRCLIANVPIGELHLASFDEALHPRAHKGETGGGRFIKKLLHELKPGDKFEHPTLGTMERLPQGGARRADGRLTVRSMVTGKRVHMNPTRMVHVAAPKALRVKKASPGRKGPSALSRELTAKVGTPAQYHAKIADMAKSRPVVTVVDKAGRAERGILQPSEFRKGEHELVTGTHILERRYHDRNDFQTHTIGLPGDLAEEKRKLDASKTIGGSKPERVGRSAYAETRIRKLGSPPENPTAEEAAQIERANKGEFTYVPWRSEATRARPFNPNDAHAVTAEDGRQAFNPATLNKGAISDVSPSAKNVGMQSPGSRKAINATSRPIEGYFPGAAADTHTLLRRRPQRYGYADGEEVATGPLADMQRRLAELPKGERDKHYIQGPKTTPVTFVSPIDGSIVTRNLTPAEHEKFMRLVEKSPEAKVKDALAELKQTDHAMENLRTAKLSSLEPGTIYFTQHAGAHGVRGVEKKGGIEVHERQGMGGGFMYRDKVAARLAQGDETVHVRAGRQTSLLPGRQVGHVHVGSGKDGQTLVDRTGQMHASGLTQEEAQRRLRAMNDAYDAEHGIGHIKRTATGHTTVPAPGDTHRVGIDGPTHQELQSAEHAGRSYTLRHEANGIPAGAEVHVTEATPNQAIRVETMSGRHAYVGGAHNLAYRDAVAAGSEPGLQRVKLGDLNVGDRIHYASTEQAQRDYANKRGGQIHPPGVRAAVGEPYGEVVGKSPGSVHLHFPAVHRPGQSEEYSPGADVYVPGGVTGSPVAEMGRRRGVEHAIHTADVSGTYKGDRPVQDYVDSLKQRLGRGYQVEWFPTAQSGRVDFQVTAPDGHSARSESIDELWRHFNERSSAGSQAINRSLRVPRRAGSIARRGRPVPVTRDMQPRR